MVANFEYGASFEHCLFEFVFGNGRTSRIYIYIYAIYIYIYIAIFLLLVGSQIQLSHQTKQTIY